MKKFLFALILLTTALSANDLSPILEGAYREKLSELQDKLNNTGVYVAPEIATVQDYEVVMRDLKIAEKSYSVGIHRGTGRTLIVLLLIIALIGLLFIGCAE